MEWPPVVMLVADYSSSDDEPSGSSGATPPAAAHAKAAAAGKGKGKGTKKGKGKKGSKRAKKMLSLSAVLPPEIRAMLETGGPEDDEEDDAVDVQAVVEVRLEEAEVVGRGYRGQVHEELERE